MNQPDISCPDGKWYEGISRYQWLVLISASLGWIFDVFEGQIFVASMREAMPSLTEKGDPVATYNNIALAAFLLGGAVGGIVFGMLSDRIGRKKTMSITIIFYSLFTCLSAFSTEWWHLAAFRFLVAMGVGGEWAVASSLIAEVFPKRSRAQMSSIFHSSSVFGTYLAIAAGAFLIGNESVKTWAETSSPEWMREMWDPSTLPWRIGFALGVLPALLIIWIRVSLKEPESWVEARSRAAGQKTEKLGAFWDLFSTEFRRGTLMGLVLAAVGMATFWGAHIYGKDVFLEAKQFELAAANDIDLDALSDDEKTEALKPFASELKQSEMWGMFLVATGGGIGLVSFGFVSQRIGRRRAFVAYHIGGFVMAAVVFLLLNSSAMLLVALPVFGFLTLGMHAGYAVYFPELFPTRLRGTGAGFCFNGGRIIAAPVLILRGVLRDDYQWSMSEVGIALSALFLVGAYVAMHGPETRDQDLME